MLSAIMAALEGLKSLKDLVSMLIDLNLKDRLNKIEERQQQTNAAFLTLASANSPEELKEALRGISSSWAGNR